MENNLYALSRVVNASICFVLCSLSIICIGCGKSVDQQASDLMDAGMLPQAKVLLSQKILDQPKNAKLHFLLGKCLVSTGNFAEAQESFDRAMRLDVANAILIGKAYLEAGIPMFDQDLTKGGQAFALAVRYDPSLAKRVGGVYLAKAKALLQGGNPLFEGLLTNAVKFDPALRAEIGEILAQVAIAHIERDECTSAAQAAAIALNYAPERGSALASAALGRIKALPPGQGDPATVFCLCKLAGDVDPSSRAQSAAVVYDRLSQDKDTDPLVFIQHGTSALVWDNTLGPKFAALFLDRASALATNDKPDYTGFCAFVDAAATSDKESRAKAIDIVIAELHRCYSDLPKLGEENFLKLVALCDRLEPSDAVKNSKPYALATALKLYVEKNLERSVEILKNIASDSSQSAEANLARAILAPPPKGKHELHMKPIKAMGCDTFQITAFESSGDSILLEFSARSASRPGFIGYQPYTYHRQTEGLKEGLYILDDRGQKHYSNGKIPVSASVYYTTTTSVTANDIEEKYKVLGGFKGGRQELDHHGPHRTIYLNPDEEVILTAEFPMISEGARRVAFVNPYGGGWGFEIPNIYLKASPFDAHGTFVPHVEAK